MGAGNSAAEIAVELAAAGATVQLSVRTPPNIVRRDVLGVPSQVIGVALRRVPEALMNPMIGLMRKPTVPAGGRTGGTEDKRRVRRLAPDRARALIDEVVKTGRVWADDSALWTRSSLSTTPHTRGGTPR